MQNKGTGRVAGLVGRRWGGVIMLTFMKAVGVPKWKDRVMSQVPVLIKE